MSEHNIVAVVRSGVIGLLGGFGLFFGTLTFAEIATIKLTDGSELKGEVLSLKGGAYEIKTQSLGVLSIPQSDIALVSYGSQANVAQPPVATTASPDAALMANVQQQLVGDPGTLSLIMGLSDDPLIQSVIEDPEIKAAIARGDFETLMAHPKMQQMMRHPTVRKITGAVKP